MANDLNEFFYLRVSQGEGENSQHMIRALPAKELEDNFPLLEWMAYTVDMALLKAFGQVLPDREWSYFNRLTSSNEPFPYLQHDYD